MLIDDTLDAVLLDAGGVLVLPDPERMRAALAPLGATPDDDACRRAHYAGMREVDRLGKADWPMVDRVVARTAGVPEDRIEEALASIERIYLAEDWVPAPGAADALAGPRGRRPAAGDRVQRLRQDGAAARSSTASAGSTAKPWRKSPS